MITQAATDGFQPDPRNAINGPLLVMEHRGGVSWNAAPTPRRWHRCKVQTRGWDKLTRIERCACGAIRVNGHFWFDKNSTRRALRRPS